MLQAEQQWLSAVREDLRWLRADDPECPLDNAAGWPHWCTLFRRRTSWVKRRVRKLLQQDFHAFCEEQMATLSLWALYRRLLRARPQWAAPGVWKCRPCGRLVKTRAALGAHFFKVHQRAARHRPFVEGTLCRACGRQYWTTVRLANHLRDHPRCVDTLRQHRLAAPTTAPGRGSKVWRKCEEESYNLAVPGHRPCPSLSTQAGTRPLWWRTRTFVMRSWSTIFRRTPPSFVLGWRLSWDATPCSQRRR